jgi:NDP-sugar pyrophosphorylase family protein
MLPIGGKPLLDHTVRWLRKHGIQEIAMNLHHCGAVVTDYFGQGMDFGVRITYSPEETLAGTAGALRKLDGFFENEALVVYGDLLTDINLQRLISWHRDRARQSNQPAITMSLYEPPDPRACGIVQIDAEGRVLRMKEKPKDEVLFSRLSFSGVLLVDTEIIDLIPRDTFCDFGYHVLPDAIQRGIPVYGLPIVDPEFVIDIGTPERYAEVCAAWVTQDKQLGVGGLC